MSGSVNLEVMSECAQVGSNVQEISVKEEKLKRGEIPVKRVGLV